MKKLQTVKEVIERLSALEPDREIVFRWEGASHSLGNIKIGCPVYPKDHPQAYHVDVEFDDD